LQPTLFIKPKNVINILVIAFGGYFLYQNIAELGGQLKLLNLPFFCFAIFLAVLAIICSAYKLKLTLEVMVKKDISFWRWLYVFTKSYIFNNLIPYSGIAYRGIYLKKHYEISYTDYISATYLFGVIGLLLLMCTAAFFLSFHGHPIFFIGLIISLILGVKFKFYFFNKLSRIGLKNEKLNFYLNKLENLSFSLESILTNEGRYLFLLVYVSSLCMDFFVYQFVLLSLEPSTPFYIMLYIYLPYSLAWLIKLTPGNFGVQEILMGGVASIVGFGLMSGVTLAILLRFVNLVSAFLLWIISATVSDRR
jgi:uncharacterized membrane protein YbhN (UPF0104 family)